MPTENKEERFNFRIKADVKDDLRITAELHGLKTAALIHTLIVKAIREEKEKHPEEFEKLRQEINLKRASSSGVGTYIPIKRPPNPKPDMRPLEKSEKPDEDPPAVAKKRRRGGGDDAA